MAVPETAPVVALESHENRPSGTSPHQGPDRRLDVACGLAAPWTNSRWADHITTVRPAFVTGTAGGGRRRPAATVTTEQERASTYGEATSANSPLRTAKRRVTGTSGAEENAASAGRSSNRTVTSAPSIRTDRTRMRSPSSALPA